MKKIIFSSVIQERYIDELKALLFFNPEQHKIVSGILSSIEKYGLPSTKLENGIIKLDVGVLKDVQALYAFDTSLNNSPLIGVMIFYRETADNIVLLHIAVKDDYTLTSSGGNSMLTLEMIGELRKIAERIKGVDKLTIYYQKDVIGQIKIKKTPGI